MGSGIYVHIPFCAGKCRYCSFYSIMHDETVAAGYIESVKAEFLLRPPKGPQDTLYIGGGTPTTIAPDKLASLISHILANSDTPEDAEVTVEANPGTLAGYDIDRLVEAGANRFSVGAQSFNPGELGLLGRRHTPAEIDCAVGSLRKAGAENIGLDLIYALPGQDMRSLKQSLEKAVALGPEHISLYDLSVDEGTALYTEVAAGRLAKPPEDVQSEMYTSAVEYLEGAGYARYEISSFARPGRECRHNMNYWSAGDYAGYGAGAVSYASGVRTSGICDVKAYMDAVKDGRPAAGGTEFLTGLEMQREFVMLALRTSSGITAAEYERRFGHGFMACYGGTLDRLSRAGYLSFGEGRIWLTGKGMLASNPVIAELF